MIPPCPCKPEEWPARPVSYAWCSLCERVVKSSHPCPLDVPVAYVPQPACPDCGSSSCVLVDPDTPPFVCKNCGKPMSAHGPMANCWLSEGGDK